MKGLIVAIMFLLLVSSVTALTGPINHNGKNYYVVTSTDPTEDSGDEVCAKANRACVGYTEPTVGVCKKVHSNAASTSSLSGDKSGVYCNGAPQGGICGSKTNTCHACPRCTVSVQCNQPIGGLYREMYVECSSGLVTGVTGYGSSNICPVVLYARNTQQFLNEIPSLNSRLINCPGTLASPVGRIINGNTNMIINMKSGSAETVSITVANNQITGISRGSGPCKNRVTISESDLDSAIASKDRTAAFARLYTSKKIQVSGCTVFRRIVTTIANPITRFIVRRNTPPPPPPTPVANCGQIGEQCNNRGCAQGGVCAAPYENINGQWRTANYRCIPISDWNSRCQATGNSRAPWDCIAYPCG